jgi:hypothetical protein
MLFHPVPSYPLFPPFSLCISRYTDRSQPTKRGLPERPQDWPTVTKNEI